MVNWFRSERRRELEIVLTSVLLGLKRNENDRRLQTESSLYGESG